MLLWCVKLGELVQSAGHHNPCCLPAQDLSLFLCVCVCICACVRACCRYEEWAVREGSFHTSTVRVINVSAALDYAVFSCTARNSLGEDKLDIQLVSTSTVSVYICALSLYGFMSLGKRGSLDNILCRCSAETMCLQNVNFSWAKTTMSLRCSMHFSDNPEGLKCLFGFKCEKIFSSCKETVDLSIIHQQNFEICGFHSGSNNMLRRHCMFFQIK